MKKILYLIKINIKKILLVSLLLLMSTILFFPENLLQFNKINKLIKDLGFELNHVQVLGNKTISKEGCTKPARPHLVPLHSRILKEGGISKKSARFSEELLAHCCRGWRWTMDPRTACPVIRPALPIETLRGASRDSAGVLT